MATLARDIKLSEFASMTAEEKSRRVNELFNSALNPNSTQIQERLNQLQVQIREFEEKHNMSSIEMEKKLSAGEIVETNDVCTWLMLLRKKNRFEQPKHKTQTN